MSDFFFFLLRKEKWEVKQLHAFKRKRGKIPHEKINLRKGKLKEEIESLLIAVQKTP